MLNYKIGFKSVGLSNIAALSVISNVTYYKYEDAVNACERFAQAASLLPEDGFIGWQLSTGGNGNYCCFAFSDLNSNVAGDDFNWIFENCAEVNAGSREMFNDLGNGNRKVYAIRYVLEGMDSEHRYMERRHSRGSDDTLPMEFFRRLLGMIGNANAIIRVIMTSDGNGFSCRNGIFVSLPDAITLRMRTILSMAFPYTVAVDMREDAFSEDSFMDIPVKCMMDGMSGLLYAVMRHSEEKPTSCEEAFRDEDFAKYYEETFTEEDFTEYYEEAFTEEHYEENYEKEEKDVEQKAVKDTGCTPIEELELSVRAYTCLKRAGIDSIEKLRATSDDKLMQIRNLGRKSLNEVKEKLADFKKLSTSIPLTAPDYSSMLEELVGLRDVKEQVRKVAALARMRRDMEERGKEAVPVVHGICR